MTRLMISAESSHRGHSGNAQEAARLGVQATRSAAAARIAELALAASTGIDPISGLASDFLNQFNEISMLLDMASEDIELLEDLSDWSPRDYVAHFEASNFRDSSMVLEAYGLCPSETRARFDSLSGELGDVINAGLGAIASHPGDPARAEAQSQALAADVRARIDALSAIIHPTESAPTNDAISAMFAARR